MGDLMKGFGTLQQYAGNVVAGRAARIQGQLQSNEKQFEAAQFEQEAKQSVAVAQRNAEATALRGKLIASRALAIGAAGGGASDPTIVKTIGDINGEMSYRAQMELYQGEEQARHKTMAAQSRRYEAVIAENGGRISAQTYDLAGDAALLKGGASLFDKYGGGKDFGNEFDNPDDYG